jgi:hypothetical protein
VDIIAKALCKSAREKFLALDHLFCGVRLARDTACEGISGLSNRLASVLIAEDEVRDGD